MPGACYRAKCSVLKGLRVPGEANGFTGLIAQCLGAGGRGGGGGRGRRGAMGIGRKGAGRRQASRERADSVLHTPGVATPLFKSDCWMMVKNYFFLKM